MNKHDVNAGTGLYPLVPGGRIQGDWFSGNIPANIQVGEGCRVDSSFCFKQFFSRQTAGLVTGSHVVFWRTSIATEEKGIIEIGDYCYLANASLVSAQRISIGNYVFIAGGVTIADSDFHPLDPAQRMADVISLSTLGNKTKRPPLESRPVVIEDNVWIGFNATILKGVHIGEGAVIEPGSMVVEDVPAGTTVSGNPARLIHKNDTTGNVC